MLERIHYRRFHQEDERWWLKANIKDQEQQGQDAQELAQLNITQYVFAFECSYRSFGFARPLHNTLEKAHHIPRGRHNNRRTEHTEDSAALEDAQQGQELARETIQARQSKRGQGSYD